MMFSGIILIGVIVYLLVRVQQNQSPFGNSNNNNNAGISAIEVAKARYARGEITHEEFEDIKKNLI